MKTLWDAPRNDSLDLIQWHHRHNPWRVLVTCVFCNMTRRRTADKFIVEFFNRWPEAHTVKQSDLSEIEALVSPLGLGKRRAKTLVDLSIRYSSDQWQSVKELPGVGKYAEDAWNIFVLGRWDEIDEPKDHALKSYWTWLWSWQDECAYQNALRLQEEQEEKISRDFIAFQTLVP